MSTRSARRAETPFGGTIAHGFLLAVAAVGDDLRDPAAARRRRHGHQPRLRQAALSWRRSRPGARIRARFVLADVKARPSGWVQIGPRRDHRDREFAETGADRALADADAIVEPQGSALHERRQRARCGSARRPISKQHVPGFAGLEAIEKFSAGQSNPTYLLTADKRPLCAARQAAGPVAEIGASGRPRVPRHEGAGRQRRAGAASAAPVAAKTRRSAACSM